jgi:hypothetical protein
VKRWSGSLACRPFGFEKGQQLADLSEIGVVGVKFSREINFSHGLLNATSLPVL